MPLQRRFASELDQRWRRLVKLVPDAVAHKTSAVNIISHAANTGDDPVRSFQAWIDEAMRQLILGNNGSWTLTFVRQAGDQALMRASAMTRDASATPDRIPQLQTLCFTELQGVCEAVSQQAVRAFGNGLLLKWPASKIARSIQRVVKDVGIKRGHLLVSFFVVRAFSAATLDSFRAAGLTHVGTLAERTGRGTPPPGSVRDAKPKSIKAVLKAEAKLKAQFGETGVDVQTAGDDAVCIVCEDISDNGPYTLDHAESLIPAHPKCRCAFVPADLEDLYDYNPDQERDAHGMWSSIGGAQFKSWKAPQHDGDWKNVEGQDHTIDEPPLPVLKDFTYTDHKTDKTLGYKQRLSSGVIMREPDGRTWLVKPTNEYGGYKYTFPKGGVEEGLHPQANAIKETFEETGLHARITGWAGDYKGDTSITRMYHAERIGGHPKDKGWETEQVALAHPDDLDSMLNRSRDKKIAKHHILGDAGPDDEARDEHGRWTDNDVLKGLGASKKDVNGYDWVVKKYNLPITSTQALYINKYTASLWEDTNSNLRTGVQTRWTPALIKYTSALNDALDKMPIYVGSVQRTINNDPNGKIFKSYADNVGKVVTEKAFLSTGKNTNTASIANADVTLYIESKHGRDISVFNPHEGGGEVLFKSGSQFNVKKVKKSTKEVWLEEIDTPTIHDDNTNESRDDHGRWVIGSGITLVHKETGATATIVRERGGTGLVTGVHVPEDQRGKGGAHAVLGMVERHLDEHKLSARLVPAAIEEGTDPERLRKLYAAHGFHAGGTNKMTMVRKSREMAHDGFDPNEPRDPDGKWTSGGGGSAGFVRSLVTSGTEHEVVQGPDSVTVAIPKSEVGSSMESVAKSHGNYSHSWESDNHIQYVFNEEGASPESEDEDAFEAAHDPSKLDMSNLTKVSGKKGSNEGGVYKDVFSEKEYYIKQPASPDHVQNELIAAKLYQLAGVKTLNYVPVEGGKHVATELEHLDKNNVSQLDPYERDAAKSDFAVHAWLANWDAAGMGGDNIGVRGNGDVVTLDTGGSLKYRAMGTPKGAAFGDTVTETDTLRDPSKNPDAAALYGDMTNEQMVASIKRVTAIPNESITKTVMENNGTAALAEQLISRKIDLQKQAIKLTTAPAPASHAPSVAPKTILGPNTTVSPAPTEQPVTAFKTKMDLIKHHLMKGTTTEELKAVTGWPSIGVPKTAADLGLTLTKTKIGGGKFLYKGTPIVPEAKTAVAPVAQVVAMPPVKSDLPGVPNEKALDYASQGIKNYKYQQAGKTHGYTVPESHVAKFKEAASALGVKLEGNAVEGGFHYFHATEPTVAASVQEAAPSHDINTPIGNFKQSLENQGIKYTSEETKSGHFIKLSNPSDVSKALEVVKYHPKVEKLSNHEYYINNPLTPVEGTTPAPVAAPKPNVVPVLPPTDAELQKAKKSTKLTAQYVPGAPAGHPEAEKLITAFNVKYEGKNDLSQGQLVEKVHAFKQLTANMVPLQNEQQKAETIKAATASATAAEKKAAAAKAEADKITNLHNLPEEEQREYWLKKISGSAYLEKGAHDVVTKAWLKEHDVTPAEVGFIRAFTGPHSGVNEELRDGHMSDQAFAFKHIMNDALAKMPKYTGDKLWRKITLSAEQQAKYVPGQIAEWKAFNSTSKNSGTWSGNTHFVIHKPKTGVDVQKISSHPSEAEVIMPANSFYKVLSNKKSGGVTYIEMEEVLPFGKAKKQKVA